MGTRDGLSGRNRFWRTIRAAGTIVADPPTGYRCVVLNCTISGVGGAAVGGILVTNRTTTANVLGRLSFGVNAANSKEINGVYPMALGEGIAVSTDGTAPQRIEVEIQGEYVPASTTEFTPLADKYTGVP